MQKKIDLFVSHEKKYLWELAVLVIHVPLDQERSLHLEMNQKAPAIFANSVTEEKSLLLPSVDSFLRKRQLHLQLPVVITPVGSVLV